MNLGQDYEARFGQDFKFKFSRDADGCLVEILKFMLIEIPKLKFDQDLCTSCDMNSNLASVVPLAMFYTDVPPYFKLFSQQLAFRILDFHDTVPLVGCR